MLRRFWILILLLIGVSSVQGQAVPRLALLNSSGQLVIASADGTARWIVTNPGETLNPDTGYTWSPDGNLLFFAIDTAGGTTARIADLATQTTTDIAQSNGRLSGGDWLTTDRVLLSDGSDVIAYSADGAQPLLPGVAATLISPYSNGSAAQGISPDGNYLIFRDNSRGSTVIYRRDRNDLIDLSVSSELNARGNGMWSDAASLVAYQGTDAAGQNVLSVTNPALPATFTLSSNSSIPLSVIGWLPDSNRLIYRDSSGQGRLADVGCLVSGCNDNPLESATVVLPVAAGDVHISGTRLVFRMDDSLYALDTACSQTNTCADSAVGIATQLAPRSGVQVAAGTVVYTAYSTASSDPLDREIRRLDLSCLPDSCQPQNLLSGAVAGAISPDGGYLVADIFDSGINIVRLSDFNLVYLTTSGAQPGAGLTTMVWTE